MRKWYSLVYFLLSSLLLVSILYSISLKYYPKISLLQNKSITIPSIKPSPTPFVFKTYAVPVIKKKQVYKIVMIGDSLTEALGPHGGGLSDYMNLLYKESEQSPQRIIINNYAKSSSILAVNDELIQRVSINGNTFGPLLFEDYDLILIESFGYNPLSQFGVQEGLMNQNLALDSLVKTLISANPHAAVVFVATIAPNIANFAKATQPNDSAEDRAKAAGERIEYLKNHIEYAKEHNIPVINIYQKSLTENGDGDRKYINPNDDIHPSFLGVDFIGREIGNFIYDNKILPK